MKITRNDILAIAKRKYSLISETTIDEIDYANWVKFIEIHRDCFIWYENTADGIEASRNINKVPDWAKERVLYSLNKKRVYCTNKIMDKPSDLVISYSESEKRVGISLERNLNKKVGEILLSMAKHLDALLLKDGTEIIDEETIKRLK